MFSIKRKLVNILVIACLLRNLRKCCGESDESEIFDTSQYKDNALRIVNGVPAAPGDVPYQVAFRMRTGKPNMYKTFCGGSIITDHKIISAAHCFAEESASDCWYTDGSPSSATIKHLFAVAGTLRNEDSYQPYDTAEGGQWRRLWSAYYPKSYKEDSVKHDVCVITLRTPFRFNKNVAPIPYASVRMQYTGNCITAGYGLMSPWTYELDIQSPILYKANFPITNEESCSQLHRRDMSSFICIINAISDIRQGDSGGPLVCGNTGDPMENNLGVLVGVTCAATKIGGRWRPFYTRVTSYHSFLKKHIDSAVCLSPADASIVLSTIFCLLNYWQYCYSDPLFYYPI